MSKGESVLISSKNTEALEVIEEKIQSNLRLDNIAIHPGRARNLSTLKKHLNYILGRSYEALSTNQYSSQIYNWEKYANGLKAKKLEALVVDRGKKIIADSVQEIERLEKNMAAVFEREKAILRNVTTHRFTEQSSIDFKNRIIKSRGIKTIPLWEQLGAYYENLERNKTEAIRVLKEIADLKKAISVKYNRSDLRNYYDFLRAKDLDRKNRLYKDLNHQLIIDTFPVWLVKASEISKILPNEKELFDYVIVDEASQCDVPSILPLLQRAKRCIVVGDQNQLGHISFLPKTTEAHFRKDVQETDRYLCQHRNYSFLTLAQDHIDPTYVSQLSEHFRSEHAIIEFSNQVVYDDMLQVLTKRPITQGNALEFVHCDGSNLKSINMIEAERIMKRIGLILKEEANIPVDLKTSIGILSPFRNQVDKLLSPCKEAINT